MRLGRQWLRSECGLAKSLRLPRIRPKLTLDELGNSLLLLQSFGFPDEIDLVLQDQDIPQLHDFNGGQMFRRLGLGTRFVSGYEQKSGVHDGGTRQHGSHENVVSGTVDEGDVPFCKSVRGEPEITGRSSTCQLTSQGA